MMICWDWLVTISAASATLKQWRAALAMIESLRTLLFLISVSSDCK